MFLVVVLGVCVLIAFCFFVVFVSFLYVQIKGDRLNPSFDCANSQFIWHHSNKHKRQNIFMFRKKKGILLKNFDWQFLGLK